MLALWHNGVVRGERARSAFFGTVPWCSGLAYVPVKDEIAGSNPVGTAGLRERSDRGALGQLDHQLHRVGPDELLLALERASRVERQRVSDRGAQAAFRIWLSAPDPTGRRREAGTDRGVLPDVLRVPPLPAAVDADDL